jgi:parallel beta-helix repeat protein
MRITQITRVLAAVAACAGCFAHSAMPAAARPADPSSKLPCDVSVRPGDDVAGTVAAAPPGAKICLDKGQYRITQPIHPASGQVIEGRGRAVLVGAQALTGFVSRGANVWASVPVAVSAQRSGECLAGAGGACRMANAVFSDGRPLRRVMQREDLAAGSFWYDREDERVYVYGSPQGHVLEMATAPVAITPDPLSPGSDVTVRNVTLRMFATPAQHGAIDVTAPGWTIAGVTAELNHGEGITTEGEATIEGSRAIDNGQEGIGGTGAHTTVVGCLIADNNWAGFDPGWEAGGAKWSVASDLNVRENTVRDNLGPGLWSDIDSTGVTYEANTVTGNERAGIFYEISSDATIAHNLVRGNGFGMNTWLWGAGILLAASHDVSVRENTLAKNADGIGLVQQQRGNSERDGSPRVLHDISIEDNSEALGSGSTGAVQDDGDEALFSDATIVFAHDSYSDFSGRAFSWDDGELDAAQWRALGHDTDGTFQEKKRARRAAGTQPIA